MTVYQKMNADHFERAFHDNDLRKDKFSDTALIALFEYLNEQPEDVYFDIVKLCSDWVEVQTEEQVKICEDDYGIITKIELPLGAGWLLQITDV